MTRCEALCKVLGWQGGTIHQVATEVGCDSGEIIYRDLADATAGEVQSYNVGRLVGRNSSRPIEFLPEKLGDVMFWIGVADSIRAAAYP